MTTTTPTPWIRTTKAKPCLICHHAGCLVTTDGAAAVCTKVTSQKSIPGVGHLHELKPSAAWAPWRVSLAKIAREAAN